MLVFLELSLYFNFRQKGTCTDKQKKGNLTFDLPSQSSVRIRPEYLQILTSVPSSGCK